MKTFLSNLDWRFATKKFDPAKKVSDEDLQKILKAIRLAPSSRGLQPFHIVVVHDAKLKQQLLTVSNNQSQVTDCQYLLIFCSYLDLKKRVAQYLDLLQQSDPTVLSKYDVIKKSLGDFVIRKEEQGLEGWANRQTYIALGFGLAACAELQIDSCPMEGFQPEEVDKVLNLPSHLKSIVYLAVGYRQVEPTLSKFRFPENDLFSYR